MQQETTNDEVGADEQNQKETPEEATPVEEEVQKIAQPSNIVIQDRESRLEQERAEEEKVAVEEDQDQAKEE